MGIRVAGYLEKRWQGFVAVRDVPPSLREAVGRIRFRKGLDTRDVHVAKARLLTALIGFEKVIQAAIRRRPATDPVTAETLAIREHVLAVRGGDLTGFGSEPQWSLDDTGEWQPDDPRDTALCIITDSIQDRAEAIERTEGRQRAEAFATVALARGTPMTLHVDAWLAEGGAKGPLRERTRDQYRADLGRFETWAAEAGVGTTIEAITKAVAGRYVAGLVKEAMDRGTANRKISTPSSYWRWMGKRGHIEVNPWTGQRPHTGSPSSLGEVQTPLYGCRGVDPAGRRCRRGTCRRYAGRGAHWNAHRGTLQADRGGLRRWHVQGAGV